MVESFDLLVSPQLSFTDLTEKAISRPSLSTKLKYFRELEKALEQENMAKVLEIRSIPDMGWE